MCDLLGGALGAVCEKRGLPFRGTAAKGMSREHASRASKIYSARLRVTEITCCHLAGSSCCLICSPPNTLESKSTNASKHPLRHWILQGNQGRRLGSRFRKVCFSLNILSLRLFFCLSLTSLPLFYEPCRLVHQKQQQSNKSFFTSLSHVFLMNMTNHSQIWRSRQIRHPSPKKRRGTKIRICRV